MNNSAKHFFTEWIEIRRAPNPQAAIDKLRRRNLFQIVAVYLIVSIVLVIGVVPKEALSVVAPAVLGLPLGMFLYTESRLKELKMSWSVLETVVTWDLLRHKMEEKA